MIISIFGMTPGLPSVGNNKKGVVMTKTPDRNLIVGLDIGTTKIAVLVGEVLPDGEVNIVGLGTHAAKGMDKGGVKRSGIRR